jgi:ABC-type multidrug transport system fused ATPase/permease subunit
VLPSAWMRRFLFVSNLQTIFEFEIFSSKNLLLQSQIESRINGRLRIVLAASLLSQDMGFFDMAEIGDLLVRASQLVSVSINLFLRAFIQAMGVLIFMFILSWKLSIAILFFIPAITIISKWYFDYDKILIGVMDAKIAEQNSAMGTILHSARTVQSLEGARIELDDIISEYLVVATKCIINRFGLVCFRTGSPLLVYFLIGMLQDITMLNLHHVLINHLMTSSLIHSLPRLLRLFNGTQRRLDSWECC